MQMRQRTATVHLDELHEGARTFWYLHNSSKMQVRWVHATNDDDSINKLLRTKGVAWCVRVRRKAYMENKWKDQLPTERDACSWTVDGTCYAPANSGFSLLR